MICIEQKWTKQMLDVRKEFLRSQCISRMGSLVSGTPKELFTQKPGRFAENPHRNKGLLPRRCCVAPRCLHKHVRWRLPMHMEMSVGRAQKVRGETRERMAAFTPPKTNMEPENGPLEKEIPIGNHHFQVPCYFWGCKSRHGDHKNLNKTF